MSLSEGDDMAFADFMVLMRSIGFSDEFNKFDRATDLAPMGFGSLVEIMVGQREPAPKI